MKTFDNWKLEPVRIGGRVRYKRGAEWRLGIVLERYRDTLEKWPFSAWFFVIEDEGDRTMFTTRHAKVYVEPVARPRPKSSPHAATVERERAVLKSALKPGATVSVSEDEAARMVAAEDMIEAGEVEVVSDGMVPGKGRGANRLRRVVVLAWRMPR